MCEWVHPVIWHTMVRLNDPFSWMHRWLIIFVYFLLSLFSNMCIAFFFLQLCFLCFRHEIDLILLLKSLLTVLLIHVVVLGLLLLLHHHLSFRQFLHCHLIHLLLVCTICRILSLRKLRKILLSWLSLRQGLLWLRLLYYPVWAVYWYRLVGERFV